MRYRVESVDTYVKSSLKDSPIWTGVPNRLVLISCYTEDPWGKNVVVVASPSRSPDDGDGGTRPPSPSYVLCLNGARGYSLRCRPCVAI